MRDEERLARLVTFLPYNLVEDVVVHQRTLEPSVWWEEGCLLNVELSPVPVRADGVQAPVADVSHTAAQMGTALRQILEHSVFPRGGYLLKFSSSGAVVMFVSRIPGAGPLPWSSQEPGVPNPAQRAARCGVELLTALQQVLPNRFTVRAGLETGRFRLALCGIPGRRLEQLVLGDLCRQVARLKDAAGASELVMGPATVDQLSGWQAHVGPRRGEGRRLMNVPEEAAGPRARVADLGPLYKDAPAQLLATLRVLVPPDVASRVERTDASALGGEVRPVVVTAFPLAFADADEVDDSALMLDLNAGISRLLETLAAHGGVPLRIDTVNGNSTAVAAFGLTETVRRASRDAVACALALCRRFSQGHAGWTLSGAVEAGRAFVGEVGSPLKREFTVVGGPADVAQHLAPHAAPGHVLVAEMAWRLCGGRVRGPSLGAFALGTPPRSVHVHDAASMAAPAATVPPTVAGQPGEGADQPSARERVLQRFERLLARVQQGGAGGALVLHGAHASGKTELLSAMADLAAAAGFRGAMARFPMDVAQHPPGAMVGVLRDLLGVPSGMRPGDCRAHVTTEMEALMGAQLQVPMAFWSLLGLPPPLEVPVPAVDASPPDALGTLHAFLAARAAAAPLLLAIEDVQHADRRALAVLVPLLAACSSMPVVAVVSASHDPDGGQAMPGHVHAALQDSGARWLAVPALSPGETETLMARELAVPSLAASGIAHGLLQAGLNAVSGSPRNIRLAGHLVRARLAMGRSMEEAWADVLEGTHGAEIWQLRMDVLPVEQRHLLRLASVLGLEFEGVSLWRTLQAGGGTLSLGTLMARLGRLVDARVLAPALLGGAAAYRFASSTLRDVAYHSVPAAVRLRWHALAGRALAVPRTHAPLPSGRIAHHLLHGPKPATAVPYLLSSAASLHTLGHMEAAAAQLEAAMTHAAVANATQRYAIHLDLARVHLIQGDPAGAERAAAGVTDDVTAPPQVRARGWVLRAQAALRADDGGGAVLASQTGRRLLPRNAHHEVRTLLGALHVEALWRYGEPERALLFSEQVRAALKNAGQVGDEMTFANAELHNAWVELDVAHAGALAALGQHAEAIRRLEALQRVAALLPLAPAHGLVQHRLGMALFPTSPTAGAHALLRAADYLHAAGDPLMAVDARLHAVRAWLRAGSNTDAQALLDGIRRQAVMLSGPRAVLLGLLHAQLLADVDVARAAGLMERVRAALQAATPRWRTLLWSEMARAATLVGNTRAAEDATSYARDAALAARAPDLLRALEGRQLLSG